MKSQMPTTSYPYCLAADLGVAGSMERLVTVKKPGLLENLLKYLICLQCGAALCQCVAEPKKYSSAGPNSSVVESDVVRNSSQATIQIQE